MPASSLSWATKVAAIFNKDLKSEFRTRYAFNALVMFAIVTLTAVSFTVGLFSLITKIQAALFWIVLFFSSMAGLAQTFIKEEEARTSLTLKLVAFSSEIYWGKFLYNLALLLALEILLVPLFIILINMPVLNWGLFLLILILGDIGLAASTTLIAAIVSKASVKGALFAILSFPILLPLLVVGINGTFMACEGLSLAEGWESLRILISYAVVMLVVSVLLFDFVWRE